MPGAVFGTVLSTMTTVPSATASTDDPYRPVVLVHRRITVDDHFGGEAVLADAGNVDLAEVEGA